MIYPNAYIIELGVIIEFCTGVLFFSHIEVGRVPVGMGMDHRRDEDDSSIACGGGCLQEGGEELQREKEVAQVIDLRRREGGRREGTKAEQNLRNNTCNEVVGCWLEVGLSR